MTVLPLALVLLSFTLNANAAAAADFRSSSTHRAARIAGGAIAGIVIGSIVFLLLICLCLALCLRRRRRAGGTMPFSRFGGNAGGQEAGYGPGPGTQGGWNQSAQPAYGGGGQYQPPQGPPPGGAPQPGGFAPPPGPPPPVYARK
ncbi:hypothetical protein ACG7TL_005615 [Trametes sanguinea]